MSTIPTIVVTPSAAADAYGRVDRGEQAAAAAISAPRCNVRLQGAVDRRPRGRCQGDGGAHGGGNLTDVVTALSRAELTLQTATAVRDRVVQAYQDIMKMPI